MFGECIAFRARLQPDTAAIETPRGTISYRRFDADINRVAQAIAALSLKPQSRVLVSDSRPYIHWLVLFALERLGHISMSDDYLGATIDVVPTDAIFAETGKYDGRAPVVVQTTPEWLGPVLASAEAPPPGTVRRPDDPVRISLSSGTTGQPRAMLYTRHQFDYGLGRMMFAHVPSRMRMLSAMGLNINAGYSYAIVAWITGGTVIYAGSARHADLLKAFGPTFMVMSPAQLQQLLADLPADAKPIANLQILLGGSPPPRTLLADAQRRLTGDLLSGYGSTEVALLAIASADVLMRHPQAAGYILPFAEVEIVDESDRPLPVGEIGFVRARADLMVHEYFGGTTETNTPFRNGWFYPGDLGAIEADGLLIIAGRTDDVINTGGVKTAAFVVEERLRENPLIQDVAAFGLPNANGLTELAAAVVGDADPAEIKRSYEERHRQAIRVFKVDTIPRGAMGKILRTTLRDELGRQSS